MAKLVINPTSASKKEIPLAGRVLSIGRDPSNDLVLSDSMVSRRHAVLEQREDNFVLRDNNSSNGTLVNGDRVVSEHQLSDGDLVAIGSARLLFRKDEALVDAAALSVGATPSPEGSGGVMPSTQPMDRMAVSGSPCATCGKPPLALDRFCRYCGAGLSPVQDSVTCGGCGAMVPLPADFCGSCGKVLTKKSTSAILATETHDRADFKLDKKGPSASADGRKAKAPPARSPESGRPKARASGTSMGDEPAGFWIRFVAYLVDAMILGVPYLLTTLAWGLALGSSNVPTELTGPAPNLAVPIWVYGVLSLVSVTYVVYFWGARGATPGKSLLGLVVQTESGETPIGFGRALLRLLGYFVSGLTACIGFLMIAISKDKRGLHDRIAGTRVTRTS